jgi:hypothetical protein
MTRTDVSQLNTLSQSYQTSEYILTDEKSFYYRFEKDLLEAKHEVIIESPFITVPKMKSLKPMFLSLIQRRVGVFIITRHPQEHDEVMADHSEAGISFLEENGIQVFMCANHHRKIAMIDRRIVWKGSLNILSHRSTHEFMERENDSMKAKTLFSFLKYDRIREINNHLLY